MNKKNQPKSNQNFRAVIELAAEKKQQELRLVPTSEDYKEVTEYMIELFAKNQKIYYKKSSLLSKLKKTIPNNTAIDRIGLKGRDEILSVLKEKKIVKEHYASFVTKDQSGQIISIVQGLGSCSGVVDIREQNECISLLRYQTPNEAYRAKLARYNFEDEYNRDYDPYDD